SQQKDPKEAIMQQVREAGAVQNAKLLKLNEHCFDKCVPKPGASLSRGEEACFSQCMQKYMDAWNAVSRRYVQHIQRESGA
ncbi:Tim10/DDP family zinc finger-domain-containing protein, partial [Lineolata rhizophorae]